MHTTSMPPLPPDAKRLLTHRTHCDRYDYLAAIACGAIGGIVDIFLVNFPKDSALCTLSDKLADSLVLKFASLCGWKPNLLQKNNVSSAIGYLEKSFQINYDQRHGSEVQSLMKMSTKNHHMLSLGHSPSPVGLFFSVLNQLTSTSSFLSQGEMVVIPTQNFGLRGDSFVQRIFFGVVNWFGHLISDVAGSSGSRGNGGRGTGIVIPFYELLSLCKFGKFQVGDARQDLATIAVRAFQEGYDLRFGMAQGIPILLADLLTRFFWAFRRHFQYKEALKNCIPTEKHSDLRIMLLCSNAALCCADITDAAFRSGGNFLAFFLRLNLAAWFVFVWRVFKELCLKIGMGEKELSAYRELNNALDDALKELETAEKNFRQAANPYIAAVERLSDASSPEELNGILSELTDKLKLSLPWEGDFGQHMSNKDGVLHFKKSSSIESTNER